MKRNQTGSVLVIILILIGLSVIVFAAWTYSVSQDGSDILSKDSANRTNNTSSDNLNYSNQEIGLGFSYPKEWGGAVLDKNSKDELLKGRDYYISFTIEKKVRATLRTPDWQESGRGSVDYDAPKTFDKKELTTEYAWGDAFEPDFDTSREVFLTENDLVITGECDAHAGTITINAYHPLKKDFKVVRFYVLFDPPVSGRDYFDENCSKIDEINPALFEKFVKFAKTIKSV